MRGSFFKIRILVQENERHLRKIKGLEQQLMDLEQVHGLRIQELLQERRRERDKENNRQKETIRQMEISLAARERIYKDRIRGLEEQMELLKDQLSKEMRRRQVFISSTSGLTHDIGELRSNLDASLDKVANTESFKLESGLLESETSRLNSTVDRLGSEYLSRLTPSKLDRGISPNIRRAISSNSVDNLAQYMSTSTPYNNQHLITSKSPSIQSSRRNLTFE